MFVGAGDDYAAARCLSLNHLVETGFPLFCQSIEKMLKALIFLETGATPKVKGMDRHMPYALKEELQSSTDYGLDKYDDVLRRLFGHFQHRYHDNEDQSRIMGGRELEEFDELWMFLFELLSFPIEVKYRLKFVSMLFEENALTYMPTYRHWVTFQNKAMSPKLGEMELTYFLVREHYINSAS